MQRASLQIRREVLLRMFEKVSRTLNMIQIFFSSTNIYIQVKKKAFKINAKIEDVGLNED